MLTDRQTGHGLLPKLNALLLVPSLIFPEISSKSVHNFLSNPANRQTDKPTITLQNIILAEVIMIINNNDIYDNKGKLL